MTDVLAWHSSCRYIFRKTRQFQSDSFQWRLAQFRYRQYTSTPRSFELKTVLPLLRAWQGPSDSSYAVDDARRIIGRTSDGKIHAEGALMHYMATTTVLFLLEHPDCEYAYRAQIPLKISLLVSASHLAKYAGCSIKSTMANEIATLYFKVLTALSYLGFRLLAFLTASLSNFERCCLLHVGGSTRFLPHQIIFVKLQSKQM